jgi:hypothetical protein
MVLREYLEGLKLKYYKFEQKKKDIVAKYTGESTSLLTSSFSTFANSFSNIKVSLKTDGNKQKVTEVKNQMEELKTAFRSGEVSYEEYNTKMTTLDKQRSEAMANQTSVFKDIMTSVSDATNQAFSGIADNMVKSAETIYTQTESIKSVMVQMTSAVIANTIASVASGKNAIKSLLMATLDGLQALVAMYSAEILAKALAQPDSVATFGATGLGRAAIIVGLLNVGMAAARAAVNSIKFEKGGLNTYGGLGDGLLTKQTTITAGEGGKAEYILNHKASMKNLNLLEHLNKGRSGAEFYKSELLKLIDYKSILMNFNALDRKLSKVEYDNYSNRDMIKTFNAMNTELIEIKRAVKSQKIESYSNYNVNVKNDVVTAAKVALNRG